MNEGGRMTVVTTERLGDTVGRGDMVIRDNRGVLHRELPCDPMSPRDMHRATLAGDEVIQ
jgi:hypothetical protein